MLQGIDEKEGFIKLNTEHKEKEELGCIV